MRGDVAKAGRVKLIRRIIGAMILLAIAGFVLYFTWWLWAVLAGSIALVLLFVLGCWMLTAD